MSDEPAQWASAIDRVKAPTSDETLPSFVDIERNMSFGQSCPQVIQEEVDDALDLGLCQGFEQDSVVDTIEELGSKVVCQFVKDMLPSVRFDLAVVRDPVKQVERADIRGHDDDGVTEIDGPTLSIGQPTVVEDL